MRIETSYPDVSVIPPLKWAGGKRWLFHSTEQKLPVHTKNYIEPFLGGAAAFFHFRPQNALLSDANSELINLYECLKAEPERVERLLKTHHKKHSESHYYEIRAANYRSDIKRAARTLYLNRTCWNGLYRVNRKGQFNVPVGTKTNVLYDTDNFQGISRLLQKAALKACDFEQAVNSAGPNDFVFADPPYTVKHNYNGFLKYNEQIFSWDDQVRLANSLSAAKRRGASIFLTNADHASIIDLYKRDFDIERVERASVIAGNAKFRGKTTELIIR